MFINSLLRHIKLTILNVDFLTCDTSWHFHRVNSPFSRLYLVTDGLAQVDHHNQQFSLKPGSLHLVPAFTTHDCHCADSFDVYFVHFTCKLDKGPDLLTMQDYDYMLKAGDWEVSLFKRLVELNTHKKLIERDPYAPVNKTAFTDDCLSQRSSPSHFLESQGLMRMLLAPFLNTARDISGQNNLQGMNRFSKVIQYIDENMKKPMTLDDLSQLVYLESGYFSNLFHRMMGVRPIEFINRKRIERAQLLLLTTNEKLDSIANQVGLSNWTYFSRVFKKYVGITPGQYRKQPHNLFRSS